MSADQFQVRHYDNPVAFEALTRSFLLAHEAENCFFIGHVPTLSNPTDVLLCAIMDAGGAGGAGGAVAGVALMTPWRHMVATRMPVSAAVALARDLHGTGQRLPGFQATPDVVDAFAREWQRLSGATTSSPVGMGIHQATRIIPPARPAPGRMRTAGASDLELLTRWMIEFSNDIGEPHMSDPAIAERRIAKGQLVIWEDAGQPVAMAGSAGATPNGIRVNAVYTPRRFRNRGYASTLVATLSQQLLDAGRRFSFLYTDLRNPTSNKIYRAIGYEPIAQSLRVEFDRAGDGR